MLLESILLRKGLRSDKIWAHPWFFREPFLRIPFYLDTQALLRSQYWSRKKIKDLSLKRFSDTVRHASSIPFWKERFTQAQIDPNSFHENDIARIPLLSKADFSDKDTEFYTHPAFLAKSEMYHTSGSTGKPFSFYHDQQFTLRLAALYERMFLGAGNGKAFPVIMMRTHKHSGFMHTKHMYSHLRGYNDAYKKIGELKRVLSKFPEKTILFCGSSALLALARASVKLHTSLPLQCVITVGEELRDVHRKEIEESLQTQVRLSYGFGEMRRVAFGCEYHRLHMDEEMVYFEITDKNGIPLPPKTQGYVVATGFENRVMPFIRYKTGDMGSINEDPCPCGRTLRTIKLEGREMALLDIGGGRTMTTIGMSILFDKYSKEIHQFQIIRTDVRSFLIRIVPGINVEYAITQLTKDLRLYLYSDVQFQWEITDSIPEGPRGKAVYFIDRFENKPPQ